MVNYTPVHSSYAATATQNQELQNQKSDSQPITLEQVSHVH